MGHAIRTLPNLESYPLRKANPSILTVRSVRHFLGISGSFFQRTSIPIEKGQE